MPIVLPNIDDELYPIGGFESPESFFEFFICDENSTLLDEPLYNSTERKIWIENSPKLENLPLTEQYIKDETRVALSDVAQELATIDFVLPLEQVFFHQGELPSSVSLAIGQEFHLLEVFSGTLDPYIANVHECSDVHWCIRVKGQNIHCYPVSNDDEYEVIILGSPKARITNIVKRERNENYIQGYPQKGYVKTLVFLELY
ncbi:hypothetical protein [Lonepinella koalarum]|uniref:hypothetical protein n=1 Tax=Lonepinella koalarum TaxID=53417 RepID=UPI003F6E3824